MPRVKTQKAAKDYPNAGIKKGETYFSWKFRYGGKHISKTMPRPSQLTQSKMSAAMAAGESLEDTIQSATEPQEFVDALNEAAQTIRDVSQEYQDGMDNMAVQGGSVYEESEEKVNNLNEWADSLESDASSIESVEDFDNWEKLNEEARETVMEEARDLAQQNSSIPF